MPIEVQSIATPKYLNSVVEANNLLYEWRLVSMFLRLLFPMITMVWFLFALVLIFQSSLHSDGQDISAVFLCQSLNSTHGMRTFCRRVACVWSKVFSYLGMTLKKSVYVLFQFYYSVLEECCHHLDDVRWISILRRRNRQVSDITVQWGLPVENCSFGRISSSSYFCWRCLARLSW